MEDNLARYARILNAERPIDQGHTKMSIADRAAQFAPLAALTGHKDSIDESSRIVSPFIELSNEEKLVISAKLNIIKEHLHTEVFTFIYFKEDIKKKGGEYLTISSSVKKIDEYLDDVILSDNQRLKIGYLYDITSPIFEQYSL